MIEVILQPDGSMLIPRGTNEENQVLINALRDMIPEASQKELKSFFSVLEDREQIFGSPGLCG